MAQKTQNTRIGTHSDICKEISEAFNTFADFAFHYGPEKYTATGGKYIHFQVVQWDLKKQKTLETIIKSFNRKIVDVTFVGTDAVYVKHAVYIKIYLAEMTAKQIAEFDRQFDERLSNYVAFTENK